MLPANLNWTATVTGDDPDQQVADTIALMSRYVREDAETPIVREAANEAAGLADDPVEGVFWYVKRLIRFQHDDVTAAPLTSLLSQRGINAPIVEVLIRPVDMLSWHADTGNRQIGDCDDYAMLTAALLRAQGIPAKFVTVAVDPSMPNQFSHVYVAAYPDGQRIALDTSHGEAAGWEAPVVARKEEWDIDAGLVGWLLAGLLVLALWSQWGKKRRTS